MVEIVLVQMGCPMVQKGDLDLLGHILIMKVSPLPLVVAGEQVGDQGNLPPLVPENGRADGAEIICIFTRHLETRISPGSGQSARPFSRYEDSGGLLIVRFVGGCTYGAYDEYVANNDSSRPMIQYVGWVTT